MNVTCGSCAARYAVPDAKVQGRKVRIKCKKCGTPILIDGTAAPDVPAEPAAAPTLADAPSGGRGGQRSASKQTMVGMPGNARATRPSRGPAAAPAPSADAAPRTSEQKARPKQRTMLGMPTAQGSGPAATPPKRSVLSGLKRAPDASAETRQAAKRTVLGGLNAPRVPAPGAAGPQRAAPEWTVAVTDDDHRELSTEGIVELALRGMIDEETFVWKEGMRDWESVFDVPALAQRLKAKGIVRRRDELAALANLDDEEEVTRMIQSPLEGTGAGWHEPGRVEAGPARGAPSAGSTPAARGASPAARAPVPRAHPPPAAAPPVAKASPALQDYEGEDDVTRAIDSPLGGAAPAESSAALRPGAPLASPVGSELRDLDDDEVTRAIDSPLDRAEAAPGELDDEDVTRAIDSPLANDMQGEEALLDRVRAEGPPAHASAESRRIGERNESSVLFSLDTLAKHTQPKAAASDDIESLLGPTSVSAAEEAPTDLADSGLLAPSTDPAEADVPVLPSARVESDEPDEPDAVAQAPAPAAGAPVETRGEAQTSGEARASDEAQTSSEAQTSGEATKLTKRPKRRRRWGLWAAAGLLLLMAGAAGAAFATKQPPVLWQRLGLVPAPEPEPESPAATSPREPEAESKPEPEQPATQAPDPAASITADEAEPEDEALARAKRMAERERQRKERQRAKRAAAEAEEDTETEHEDEGGDEGNEEVDAKPQDPTGFDRAAAAAALAQAAANAPSCKQGDGPTGSGQAIVTFAPSGRVTTATVSGDFAGTAVGGCVARLFRQATVPPFEGEPVPVAKSFRIE